MPRARSQHEHNARVGTLIIGHPGEIHFEAIHADNSKPELSSDTICLTVLSFQIDRFGVIATHILISSSLPEGSTRPCIWRSPSPVRGLFPLKPCWSSFGWRAHHLEIGARNLVPQLFEGENGPDNLRSCHHLFIISILA